MTQRCFRGPELKKVYLRQEKAAFYAWVLKQYGLESAKGESECTDRHGGSSLLAHSTDIDDLLEGLDGVLEDGLDGLHDTEAALHVVDLGLHALDRLHLAGDLDERLTVVKSLEDSRRQCLLDVLDCGGLRDGGISITAGLRVQGGLKFAVESHVELVEIHSLKAFLGLHKAGR